MPWELGNCKIPGGVGEARWDACMARVKVQRREREQEKNDRGREKAKEVRSAQLKGVGATAHLWHRCQHDRARTAFAYNSTSGVCIPVVCTCKRSATACCVVLFVPTAICTYRYGALVQLAAQQTQ